MRRAVIALLMVLCITPVFSADKDHPVGARSAGLAYATVMLPDFWSVFHNQGGLAYINRMSAGMYHNLGIIKEMSYQSVAFAYPVSTGTFALSGTYFGYSKYNELKVGLGFGKMLAEHFSLGVQIDYYSSHVQGITNNLSQVTFEAGMLYEPVDNLFIGAHVFNPANSFYNTAEAHLPSVFRFGCGYSFDRQVMLTMELEKDIEGPAVIRSGIEYSVFEDFHLRTGVIIQPLIFSFGLGYQLADIKGDIAFFRHQVLGYVPHISMQIDL